MYAIAKQDKAKDRGQVGGGWVCRESGVSCPRDPKVASPAADCTGPLHVKADWSAETTTAR